jgi:hypothetical protein
VRRKKHEDVLTSERIEFLIRGRTLVTPDVPPFSGEEEVRECWKQYRRDILARMSAETGTLSYIVGTRPIAFWRFDRNCEPPKRQAARLEVLGELSDDERAAVIRLARTQLEQMHNRPIGDDHGIDADLLRVWPYYLQIFDYDLNTHKLRAADWVKRRESMTEDDWDAIALDPVTAYSYVGVFDGHNYIGDAT